MLKANFCVRVISVLRLWWTYIVSYNVLGEFAFEIQRHRECRGGAFISLTSCWPCYIVFTSYPDLDNRHIWNLSVMGLLTMAILLPFGFGNYHHLCIMLVHLLIITWLLPNHDGIFDYRVIGVEVYYVSLMVSLHPLWALYLLDCHCERLLLKA